MTIPLIDLAEFMEVVAEIVELPQSRWAKAVSLVPVIPLPAAVQASN